jgi:hypothetical protein
MCMHPGAEMNVCGLVRAVCVEQTGESNAGRCIMQGNTVQNADDGYLMAELMCRLWYPLSSCNHCRTLSG